MARTFRGIVRDLTGKGGAGARAGAVFVEASGSEGDAEDEGEKKSGLVSAKSE